MVSDPDANATSDIPLPVTEPLCDGIRDIADRRLSQISEVLGLDPDSFRLTHEAALAASQGAPDRALSEQCLRVAQALASIADPVLRGRLTRLFGAAEPSPPRG